MCVAVAISARSHARSPTMLPLEAEMSPSTTDKVEEVIPPVASISLAVINVEEAIEGAVRVEVTVRSCAERRRCEVN